MSSSLVGPHVIVSVRRLRVAAGFLEPEVLDRGVLRDQVDDHAQSERLRLVQQDREVRCITETRIDGEVVGDVVPAVAVRRGVERQQPETGRAEPTDVLEALGDATEIAPAVTVGVEEVGDVDLVDHRVAVPQRLHRPSLPAARCPRWYPTAPGGMRPAEAHGTGAREGAREGHDGAGDRVRGIKRCIRMTAGLNIYVCVQIRSHTA